MTWQTDKNGVVATPTEIKLFTSGAFGNRLNDFKDYKGKLRITTYSLPNLNYIKRLIGERPHDIFIIANTEFFTEAVQLKKAFPKIEVCLLNNIHAKVCLIEPRTVYISSANFGNSNWIEATVGIKSVEIYDFYLRQFNIMWKRGGKIK